MHSSRQYFRSLYPSLNFTSSFLIVRGPNPGAPAPPRMHAGMHLRAQRTTASPLDPEVSLESGAEVDVVEVEVDDVDVRASSSPLEFALSSGAERDVGKSVALARARIAMLGALEACSNACGGGGAERKRGCGGGRESNIDLSLSFTLLDFCVEFFLSFCFSFEEKTEKAELHFYFLSRSPPRQICFSSENV